jgi:hypothetical protein
VIGLPLLHAPTLMPARATELAGALAGFARTSVPLVIFDHGGFRPAGAYDDSGLYLYTPLAARYFGTGAAGALTIVLASFLVPALVAALLALPRLFRSALGRFVGVGAIVGSALVAWWVGDEYVASAAAVLAVLPFAATLASRPAATRVLVLLGVSGLFLGLTETLRAGSSLPALLFTAMALAVSVRWQRRARLAALAALVIGTCLPVLGLRGLQANRDRWLTAHVAGYQVPLHIHPVWHSVYIGFGFLNNELGLRYKDEVAIERVRQLDPGAGFVTPRYEAVMRGEVFRLVHEQPVFVLVTEAAKAGVLALMLVVFMNVGLAAAFWRRASWRLHLPFWGALVAGSLAGFMAIPHLPYVLGFTTTAALYGAVCVDHAFFRHRT